ncbi:dihydrolipoamide acetyltransferase family protein [Galactobacter caseinivorans]|uniref:Dihydrolipoamide acetyltransferase component of pyruvate dehydrogenase complex n=1 Tax=Galactobacter caseinivorans TaxID=2676123 RepID=A0A496PJS8_9MICC|nr:dihydrolipoamide acetyltransferase family protein [Galactobacter caseinivorans]RKW70753.1 2-oxo acid dehydrogenase subunit E2 [Galactobacter caseinivorans]
MQIVFPLPDLGEGLTESEVVSWNVKEGEMVTLNQVLGEVETAKAVVELPSPYAGMIGLLHAGPGDVVEVGKPLVTFQVEGEEPAPDDEDERTPSLVGYGAPTHGDAPVRRRRGRGAGAHSASQISGAQVSGGQPSGAQITSPTEFAPVGTPMPPAASAPQAPVDAPASDVSPTPGPRTDRPRSTPPVRKLARDAGVDLEALVGTGMDGLITREDVTAAIAGGVASQGSAQESAQAPQSASAGESGREGLRTLGGRPRTWQVPVKGVKKATANAMVASMRDQPQVTEFLTVDVTRSMELIAELKRDREFRDVKFSPLTLVSKAVCIAMEREPGLNARWAEQNITMQSFVNLGIAAATERGLVVPNIKDAQALSLKELALAINDLAATARAGKTAASHLSGGTFTITNVGVFGVDAGTPILNPGETGILAIGQVRRTPWEHRGEIALREVMTLSLTFDHRVVDGAEGSRFLADIGAILNNPGRTLTML